MPKVMAAQPNIGGAFCWMLFNQTQIFAPGKIPLGGKSSLKCIYSVRAHETAKHRAKFGWLPLSDIGAVTKRNLLKFVAVPQTRQPVSRVSGPKFTMLWGHVEEIMLFNNFSDCRYTP